VCGDSHSHRACVVLGTALHHTFRGAKGDVVEVILRLMWRDWRVVRFEEEVKCLSCWGPGDIIAAGDGGQRIHIICAGTGQKIQTVNDCHSGCVNAVTWSPDGKCLASASDDKTAKIWTLSSAGTYVCQSTLDGHSNLVVSICFSPDGAMLASGSWDKTVNMYTCSAGTFKYKRQSTLTGDSPIECVLFNPSGDVLAAGDRKGNVRLCDPTTGDVISTLNGHSRSVTSVTWSPDGTMLASGSEDTTVKVWDTQTGDVKRSWRGHSDYVRVVCFSPNSSQIASASDDKTVIIWDVQTGANIASPLMRGHSPDNSECTCQHYDEDGDENYEKDALCPVNGHSNRVTSVTWSPDGTMLISGSFDKTIKVWDKLEK
jgi:WD40 repeat protein